MLTTEKNTQTLSPKKKKKAAPLPNIHEGVVLCPNCKTMETLLFNNGHLMETRKFYQRGDQVFHDCGSSEPCRLYRGY